MSGICAQPASHHPTLLLKTYKGDRMRQMQSYCNVANICTPATAPLLNCCECLATINNQSNLHQMFSKGVHNGTVFMTKVSE